MKRIVWPLLSIFLLLGLTTVVYLKSSGYEVNLKKKELNKTGMIAVKSNPDGAQVFLDGILTTATNGTITDLKPGTFHLRVVKNGFVTWEKKIEVFEQLVTDITAVLVSKTPRLEPLTSEGARAPAISPSLTKIAYFTKNGSEPGVWILPLAKDFEVNLFKTTPDVMLKDTPRIPFSNGQELEWSPDERELLVKMADSNYYLMQVSSRIYEATSSSEPTKKRWLDKVSKKREVFLDQVGIPEELRSIAMDPKTTWSPDEKKFLYKEVNGDLIEYKIHNLEKPLPVGESVKYTTFSIKQGDPEPRVYWYSDSFHLILIEGNIKDEKKGTIYLIRIDGTNKTEIYNNTLLSDFVFPTPSGDKIIVLTSFKSDGQSDLYATGIR